MNIAHHRHESVGPWRGIIEWPANRSMRSFATLDEATIWFWTGPYHPGDDDPAYHYRLVADGTDQAVIWFSPHDEVPHNRLALTDQALARCDVLFPDACTDELRRLCWLRQFVLGEIDDAYRSHR